jgi:hypothetical protein
VYKLINRSKDGSKTVVIYVIGFLCVSLGSSTVQVHESLGSRRACTFFFFEAIGTAATSGLLCQPRVIVKMIVEKQM